MNLRYALIVAGLSLLALPAFGGVIGYPSTSSTVVDNNFSNPPNTPSEFCCFYSAARGDSVTQTFTGTGIASLIGLSLNFGIDDQLSGANETDWNVLVNGTVVGTWVWTTALDTSLHSGTLSKTYSFAPITGSGTYTLRMAVTNEVPSGPIIFGGSIGILLSGATTTLNPAPEPGTMLLLGGGLLGLVVRRMRMRKA